MKKSKKRKRKNPVRIFLIFMLMISLLALIFAINYKSFQKIIYPQKYEEQVYRYSLENKVDPYLVFAIIKAESDFDTNATSNKKAMGLMQITKETALWGAEQLKIENFKINDLYEPETNIRIGCWYISKLMKEFNSIENVIAAYNGGSGNVKKWLMDESLSTSDQKLKKIPFKETENFLKRVLLNYKKYKNLYNSA